MNSEVVSSSRGSTCSMKLSLSPLLLIEETSGRGKGRTPMLESNERQLLILKAPEGGEPNWSGTWDLLLTKQGLSVSIWRGRNLLEPETVALDQSHLNLQVSGFKSIRKADHLSLARSRSFDAVPYSIELPESRSCRSECLNPETTQPFILVASGSNTARSEITDRNHMNKHESKWVKKV